MPNHTVASIEALAERLLGKTHGALDAAERRVLESIHLRQPLSRNATAMSEEDATPGERLADRVAAVGGSWGFIITFGAVLLGWMLLNSQVFPRLGLVFDPYPFIFLNLMLSTLAAIQAPIIMMSQNRQADKDRMAAALDFEVNLRAELEILRLHIKLDEAVIVRLDALLARQQALEQQLGLRAAPGPDAA